MPMDERFTVDFPTPVHSVIDFKADLARDNVGSQSSSYLATYWNETS